MRYDPSYIDIAKLLTLSPKSVGHHSTHGKNRLGISDNIKLAVPPGGYFRYESKLIAKDTSDDYVPPDRFRVIAGIDVANARTLTSMFGHSMPAANGDIIFFVQIKPDGDGGMLPLPFDKVAPAGYKLR